jgi:hypothetical protein
MEEIIYIIEEERGQGRKSELTERRCPVGCESTSQELQLVKSESIFMSLQKTKVPQQPLYIWTPLHI